MPVRKRLVVAGAVCAAAIAVPAAALALGSGSPSGNPPSASSSVAATPGLHDLATAAGISVERLRAGLIAAKQAGGNTTAGIAAFAAAARVSATTAQQIVRAVSRPGVNPSAVAGKSAAASEPQVGRSLTASVAVAALASRLDVSNSEAHRALRRIDALSGPEGVDPTSPAFAAIARRLGVTPDRLAAALPAVKEALAGK